jgi:iron(II)-dependent oxidoreductase
MMSLVPTGPVLLGPPEEDLDELEADWNGNVGGSSCGPPIARRLLHVESYFLDQHPVTNAEYQKFVDDGGYEHLAIWDPSSLPAMLDFIDETGEPGPRFWANGNYPEGEDDLPVVGISWYEALAFARWAGKRLPTDAEWVKAGAWPVESSPGCLTQRRYPWGDSHDAARANIWGSGPGKPVAVDRYKGGTSVGGSCQLIGNVWEWTASGFGDPDDPTLRLPKPMKAIRGGAFDTYFESQATCHFQSGDSLLARKHNIGFRLAIGVCDLAPEATGLVDSSADPLADADGAWNAAEGAVPNISSEAESGAVFSGAPGAPSDMVANGNLTTTSVEEAI